MQIKSTKPLPLQGLFICYATIESSVHLKFMEHIKALEPFSPLGTTLRNNCPHGDHSHIHSGLLSLIQSTLVAVRFCPFYLLQINLTSSSVKSGRFSCLQKPDTICREKKALGKL
jgi:hypothetical protein